MGEGAHRSSEKIYHFLRMALDITSHHKYVQLSSSSRALPIRTRLSAVMMLGLEFWPNIIIEHAFHVALWIAAAKLLRSCLWLVGLVYRLPTVEFM